MQDVDKTHEQLIQELATLRQRGAALEVEMKSCMTECCQLERELLEISERERRRIGYDLHDSLGQHLTGIAFLSKVLAQRLKACHAEEAAEAAQIVAFVNQAIE